jgi:hypothetical protein
MTAVVDHAAARACSLDNHEFRRSMNARSSAEDNPH